MLEIHKLAQLQGHRSDLRLSAGSHRRCRLERQDSANCNGTSPLSATAALRRLATSPRRLIAKVAVIRRRLGAWDPVGFHIAGDAGVVRDLTGALEDEM